MRNWIRSRLLRAWCVGDEDGTVTVDFVVLTAALATLGLVVFSVIETGLVEVSSDIAQELTRTWN